MEGLVFLLKAIGAAAPRLARGLEDDQSLLAAPGKNAFARDAALARLARTIAEFPDTAARAQLQDWLKVEQAAVASHKDEFRYDFGRDLVAALEGTGLAVKGQLPQLRIGLFSVEADFDSGKATIFWGPRVEKLKTGLSLDPVELAQTLVAWRDRLSEKAVPPEKMLDLLHTAYRRHVLLNSLGAGARVFLSDILAEVVLLLQPAGFRVDPVQEKFVEYPRVRFSYDLFRLKESGEFAHSGAVLKLHVANFDATTEKAKALWVPDNEEGDGTHYSYVSFVRGS